MKKVRIVVFALLIIAVGALTYQINEYQHVIADKEDRIDMIRGHLVDAELELQEKDKYIKQLHESVESLNADLTTLEEKLNELSIAKDKLE